MSNLLRFHGPNPCDPEFDFPAELEDALHAAEWRFFVPMPPYQDATRITRGMNPAQILVDALSSIEAYVGAILRTSAMAEGNPLNDGLPIKLIDAMAEAARQMREGKLKPVPTTIGADGWLGPTQHMGAMALYQIYRAVGAIRSSNAQLTCALVWDVAELLDSNELFDAQLDFLDPSHGSRLYGRNGGAKKNRLTNELKEWAKQKAKAMRGADRQIAEELCKDLPPHLVDASKDPFRLIVDALRAERKATRAAANQRGTARGSRNG